VAAGDYTASTQDKPAVAVTAATAAAWGGRDMSALLRHCTSVVAGSVAGSHTPVVVGGCRLPKPYEFADDTALFAALRAGQVNVAWTTTAAPDSPSDVVVLADRTSLIRAENLVPLYRRNELNQLQLRAVNELAGVLDTAALADMRRQVAGGADPAAVADGFLAANPLGH
jgi:glycine betaine/choline ABC-type transport system substrate-binding protein